jgi:hypothetical protein
MSRRARQPGPISCAINGHRMIHGVTEIPSAPYGVDSSHDVNIVSPVNTARSIILIQASGFTRKDLTTHIMCVLTDLLWLDSNNFRIKFFGTYSVNIPFDIPYTVIEFPPGTRVRRMLQDINDSTIWQHKVSFSLSGLGFLRYAGIVAHVLPISKPAFSSWAHTYDLEYHSDSQGKDFEGAKVDEASGNLDLWLAGSVPDGRILAWLVQP